MFYALVNTLTGAIVGIVARHGQRYRFIPTDGRTAADLEPEIHVLAALPITSDLRPAWLRRGIPARDDTGAIRYAS